MHLAWYEKYIIVLLLIVSFPTLTRTWRWNIISDRTLIETLDGTNEETKSNQVANTRATRKCFKLQSDSCFCSTKAYPEDWFVAHTLVADLNSCASVTDVGNFPDIKYTQDPLNSVTISISSTDSQDEIVYTDFQFGDGTRYQTSKDVDIFNISHTYFTPGPFLLQVGVMMEDKDFIHERWVWVKTEFLGMFTHPFVNKSTDLDTLSFITYGGTNLTLEISVEYKGSKIIKEIEKVGCNIQAYAIGGSVLGVGPPPEATDVEQLVLVSSLVFKEYGFVSALELNVNSSGLLKVAFMRPQCDCCVGCENDEDDIQLPDDLEFKITKVVMINITTTGLQLHRLHFPVNVSKGDMLALVQSSKPWSSKLTFGRSKYDQHFVKTQSVKSILQEANSYSFLKSEMIVPDMRVHLSKAYDYKFHDLTGIETISKITVTESSSKTTMSIPVDVEVSGGSGGAGLPTGPLKLTFQPGETGGRVRTLTHQPLKLIIHIGAGFYLTLEIDWGDNSTDIIDHTTEPTPDTLTATHMYWKTAKNATFSLVVTARNKLGTVVSNTIIIERKNCTDIPQVNFNYGRECCGMVVSRGQEHKLFADVWYGDSPHSKHCQQKYSKEFHFHSCQLEGGGNVTMEELNTGIQCRIPQRTLDVGSKRLVLHTTFKDQKYNHTAYLDVVQSNLTVSIRNGGHQSIPQKQKLTRVDPPTNYIFEVDGSLSHDPDEPGNKEGLVYVWSCSVKTNGLQPGRFCNGTKEQLQISVDGTCVVEEPLSKLYVNTSCLMEEAVYVFHLVMSKADIYGSRTAAASQEIEVRGGAPPNVKMICVSNCLTKVNTGEDLIMRSQCSGCFGRKIEAVWKITDRQTMLPLNIDFSTSKGGNLLINRETLNQGKQYDISGVFNFPESPNSKSEVVLSVQTSRAPQQGTCEVSPSWGEASIDQFRISCQEWRAHEADDEPLQYEFRYTICSGEEEILVNPTSFSNNEVSNVLLPPGCKKDDFGLSLTVRVSNKFGSYASWHSNVTVEPPNHDDQHQEDVMKTLMQNKPKVLTDTQAVAGFVSAAGKVLETLSPSVPISSEPTTKPDVFGKLMGEEQRKREEAEKEKARQKKMKNKDTMIDMLGDVPVDNIQQIKAVSDALSTVTATKEEVSTNSSDKAINMIERMSHTLEAITSSGAVGAVYMEKATTNYVQSISNLLDISVKPPEEKALNEEKSGQSFQKDQEDQEELKEKERKNKQESAPKIKSLVNALTSYAQVLLATNVVGNPPKKIKTPTFELAVKKVEYSDMANMTFLEEDEDGHNGQNLGFKLPNMTSQFDDLIDSGKDISMEKVNYKENIFSWGNESNKIKSEVYSLTLRSDGNESKVNNLPEPIVINIKNKPGDLVPRNISLFLPRDVTFIKNELESEDCKMLVDFGFINDPDNMTELIVYIQYGMEPSQDNFDVKLHLARNRTTVLQVGTEVNITSSYNGTVKHCSYERYPGDTRERYVDVQLIDNRTILMHNFDNYFWAATNCSGTGKNLHFAYHYIGPLPNRLIQKNDYTFDAIEYRGSYNYSVRTFCAKCSYWSEREEEWTNDGCDIDESATTMDVTSCKCNHLTSFGGFFVSPNPILTPSIGLLAEGYVLLVTVLLILLFYIGGLLLARRADKCDVTKVGTCVLPDNDPLDQYLYEIIVDTGKRYNSGTKSNVFFIASGDYGDSRVHHLRDPERETFMRSSSDSFLMTTPSSIGDLNYIRIWHDNSDCGWFLEKVTIRDLQTKKSYHFVAERWLAVDKYDGMIDCRLYISGAEITDFNYVFNNNSRSQLRDRHLWFSIYTRPPHSTFTRCQRLSVLVSLLFCSMLVSCMFYDAIPNGPAEEENRIGDFSFHWNQVYIAIVCALITAPINILLAAMFRAIRPKDDLIEKREDSDAASSEKGGDTQSENTKGEEESARRNASCSRGDGDHVLPYWFLYVTWTLCLVVILACAIIVVLYGMTFGNTKSLEWLASVTLHVIEDIFLVQPLTAIVFALSFTFCALNRFKSGKGDAGARNGGDRETWLKRLKNHDTIFDRIVEEPPQPPNLDEMESMRAQRLKELKMAGLVRELIFYVVFILVVVAIGINLRDHQAYNQTKDMKGLLRLSVPEGFKDRPAYRENELFEEATSFEKFWDWIDTLLLPQLYPKKWYNLSPRYDNSPKKDFPGRIFLNDLSSKLVTGARVRQMRVKPNSCALHSAIRNIYKKDCAGPLDSENEEKRAFNYNWNLPYNSSDYIPPINIQNKPWRYQDSHTLNTYNIDAQLHSYDGGGYVVEFFPKFDNPEIIKALKHQRWVDRHTRVVIVELATYNAQSNFYNMVIVVFEFPGIGGVVHWSSVQTFRLELYSKQSAFFVILTYVIYLIFMLIFCIREARQIHQQGCRYFLQFWNLVELSLVLLSVLGIIFFCYIGKLRKSLLEKLPNKVPNVFINFHFASIWYDLLIHIIALVCFFVIIKLIKMLRFNNRIYMLSATLKAAWGPLAMFFMMFLVVIGSVVFSTYIIFGHDLYGYRNWGATFGSICGLLLGKFEYAEFANTNANLGPLFFFAFNIFVNMIVMNVFISILNDTFAAVQAELLAKENEYDLLEYMMETMKNWIGLHSMDKSISAIQQNWDLGSDLGWDSKSSSMGSESDLKSGQKSAPKSRSKLTSKIDSKSNSKSILGMDTSVENHSALKSRDRQESFATPILGPTSCSYANFDIEMDKEKQKEFAEQFVKALHFIRYAHSDATKKKMAQLYQKRNEKQRQMEEERKKGEKEKELLEQRRQRGTGNNAGSPDRPTSEIFLQPGECEESTSNEKKLKRIRKGWKIERGYTNKTD